MSFFSDRFKKLRLSKGYTQEKLAELIGLTKSRINMYERGEREPNFETLELIADFYNVDMNFLIGKESPDNLTNFSHNLPALTPTEEQFIKNYRSLNEKIKLLRKSLNLTLEDVGNIVGVGKSTVRKWENGDIANMRRDKIAKLAEALHTTPAFLMGWEESSCNNSSNNNMSNPVISKEALKVAQAYDKADDTKKAIVKLTLGVDEAVKNEMHCEQCEDVG